MIISKKTDGYLFNKDHSVRSALKHLDESRLQILFLVDSNKRLCGVVTDGDIRRWLLRDNKVNLSSPISVVAPERYVSALKGSRLSEVQSNLKPGLTEIPLVDENGILAGIIKKNDTDISFGPKSVGEDHPAYIVAEIGNNHQGSLAHAKRLIEVAAEAEVDSVKFQLRSMDYLYGSEISDNKESFDLGVQYTTDLLSKYQLPDDDLFTAFDYCKQLGVEPICTPWDMDSLKKLENYGLVAYKVASADFTNHELLEAIAKTNCPMICSTGMCDEAEISDSVKLLKDLGAQCILLHCNSTYPTPFKDVNLKYMSALREFGYSIGYSGHERGFHIALAAVGLGACVVEKHITLDKNQEGNDHKVSLLPDEFKLMVAQIRDLEAALGTNKSRVITQGELINRESLAKSLYATKKITVGDKITRDSIGIKSPGQGLQPNKINLVIGRIANRDIERGSFLFNSDLEDAITKKDHYEFDRPYGIPVRYHDFKSLTSSVNMDFVEFHLSYQDLLLNPSDFIPSQKKLSFTVHCPELFENDHILDLCSKDDRYRNKSIDYLNQVVLHCDLIAKCFPKSKKIPTLVLNAGGWTNHGFISSTEKLHLYDNLADSLSKVNTERVQIAIQTMPPFPWHFGGQSFHNLFVSPAEIDQFCKRTNHKICLDISHTMMACNYNGWSLYDFIRDIAQHIIYLHVVDAVGSDGEGIQIGKGDVDFHRLSKLLNSVCESAPFIPEIWQGHKDNGAGFWNALNFLEPYL